MDDSNPSNSLGHDPSNLVAGHSASLDGSEEPFTPNRFKSKAEYKDFFFKLLDQEMKEENYIKKVRKVKDVRIQYTEPIIRCIIKVEDLGELAVGDELVIKNSSRNREAIAPITNITDKEVHIDFTHDLYKGLRKSRPRQRYTVMHEDSSGELRNIIEDNIGSLRWKVKPGGYYFTMNPKELGYLVSSGTFLDIKDQEKESESTYMVQRYFRKEKRVYLTYDIKTVRDSMFTSLYEVSLHCNTIVYNRMFEAIYKFSRVQDFFFTNIILGSRIINNQAANPKAFKENRDASPLVFPQLKESEFVPVQIDLNSKLLLMQGINSDTNMRVTHNIILNLFENLGKVLVAAPSNRATDQIASSLLNTKLRMTRFYSNLRQKYCPKRLRPIAFHNKIKEFKTVAYEKLDRKRNNKSLTHDATIRLLDATDVMICTCAGAYDPRISKFPAQSVVIYESARGQEPECLMPILKAKKKIIMIGDLRQKPFCVSDEAGKRGLSTSLFERLVSNGNVPHILS